MKSTNQKKLRLMQNEKAGAEYIQDNFDRTVIVDNKNDICALCKEGYQIGILMNQRSVYKFNDDDSVSGDGEGNSIMDVDNVWASKYSIANKQKRRIFVHFQCALVSPQTWFQEPGNIWHNLNKEVVRGGHFCCYTCKKKGATVGCIEPRCGVVVHFPCALSQGFIVTRYKSTFLCPEHQEAEINQRKEKYLEVSNDLSKGKETLPVSFLNNIDIQEPPTFSYTKGNVDSDDLVRNERAISSIACCKCDGLCDDVAVCECLQGGKNYSMSGDLLPDLKHEIVECNLRCSCSIRRCSNRVVGNGLRHRLQLFRVATKNHKSHTSVSVGNSKRLKEKNTWGVRTLDHIPKNSFVCEVTGQFVVGSSILDATENSSKMIVDELLPSETNKTGKILPRILPINYWEECQNIDIRSWTEKMIENEESSANILIKKRNFAEVDVDQFYEQLRDFLKGNVCLDSRNLKNIGAFIRKKEKRKVTTSQNHSSTLSNNLSSFIGEEEKEKTIKPKKGQNRMLIPKLVYMNKLDKTFPRLALFAAEDIEANTELFI